MQQRPYAAKDSIYRSNMKLITRPKLTFFTKRNIEQIPQFKLLPIEIQLGIKVAIQIFPFRVNQYVLNELIDWNNWEKCPIFRLTFPQPEMLNSLDYQSIERLMHSNNHQKLTLKIQSLRQQLNPHPAGQKELNIPTLNGIPLNGLQHKYKETVLFFPAQGQTCHSYCSFCFRWAQFVGDKELKFSSSNIHELVEYLKAHTEVTDVIFTGGDPMVMNSKALNHYITSLLIPELDHIQNIRIGSKALTFWPYRFVTDEDSKVLLDTFEKVAQSGKHLAFMAHYNHGQELHTEVSQKAISLIRQTGAEIRSQGPLLKGINDSSHAWASLWQEQVKQGIIPYYMFIERDTGPKHFFEIPLAKAWKIYSQAINQVSGLCRTARGPSMSMEAGKIEIQGVTEIYGQKVFVLRFIQGRNPNWVQQPFFAQYDESATWFHDLKPAFTDKPLFFFQDQ